jgi:hypothetical protein
MRIEKLITALATELYADQEDQDDGAQASRDQVAQEQL